jgi:PAS domain S-box-containing protein
LVFAIALMVTGLLVINVADSIGHQDRSSFDNETARALEAINQRIHTTSTLLRGAAGLFAASEHVDRDEFRSYVSTLDLRDRYPGILGIGYVQRVAADELDDYEARVREELPGFAVWPDDPRPYYHAIQFLEPMDERNRAAIGYDMFTNPVRRKAMAAAAERDEIVASGKVTLVQEIDAHKQSGFLLYMPVYENSEAAKGRVPRERPLRGFVYTPLRAGDLLSSVRGSGARYIDYEVFDGTEPDPAALLRTTKPGQHATARFHSEHVIEVGGRPWLVRFHSRPQQEALSQAWLIPWLALTAFASSLLLAWLSWSQVRARRAAELAARTQQQFAQALHEERERLSATLASIGDGVVAVDAAARIVLMNPVAERLTGWTNAEALGRELDEVVTVASPAEDDDEVGASIGAQGSGEVMLHSRDGSIRPVDHSSAPIPDQSGKTAGAVIVMRDATERNRVEAELRSADRRKDQFLAMLAHELRNPLAPICNSLELLRRQPDPELAERARAVAERQARLMVRLVNDLLDLSRISRGTILLQREPVLLDTVLQTAVETSLPLIDSRQHTLRITVLDPDLRVDGDPARLAQVFSNLLNNAATYTDPGGLIELDVRRDGDDVRVTVRDNGIGIRTDSLPHVFDMFMQVDHSLERSGGLGIGLTLVQRLLHLHGGNIVAHSAGLGTGSEFVARLPLFEGDGQARPVEAEGEEPTPQGPLRILVVDDNIDTADSLAMMLRLDGHEVDIANDGHAAVQQALASAPDVVLLDIGLPGMNGYDVARRLRSEHGTSLMLVAITGWGQDSDRRRALEAGFDHHMVKPIDYPTLAGLLAKPR